MQISIFLKKHSFSIFLILFFVLVLSILVFFLKEAFYSFSEPIEKPFSREEILKPGTVGEIDIEKLETSEGDDILSSIQNIKLPPIISNTAGIIKEIKSDRVIVQGSGSNFADRKMRDLIVIFTTSTITKKINQKTEYKGFEALEHLREGMTISIKGFENLRGKIEFRAESITVNFL